MDSIPGKTELVIVTESGRCSWARCIFCSFSKKPDIISPDFGRLKRQLDSKLTRKYHTLKYLNSGSFLDKNQIPEDFQKYLIKRCIDTGIKELVIECRAEHITPGSLKTIKDASKSQKLKIYFALGLEVADNKILKKICKGFTTDDYLNAVSVLKRHGFYIRTYLMANLPYIGNHENLGKCGHSQAFLLPAHNSHAIKNIQKSLDDSVSFALKHSDSVAIINTFAYGYAPLFDMWLKKTWRPLDKNEFSTITKKYMGSKEIDVYFDDYITYPRFKKQEPLVGATSQNLENPVYDVWQDYIVRFYEKPAIKKYALFLPCSYRKPYSCSRTHKEILKRLTALPFYASLHQLMVSNPGVIPREFESKYPFAHYDWPEWEETPAVKKEYIKVTGERIGKYLAAHKYKKVFAYFKPESESYIALKSACKKQKIDLISCVDENVYRDFKDNQKTPLVERRLLDALIKTLRKHVQITV